MSSLLHSRFTTDWSELMVLIMETNRDLLRIYLTCYTFQVTIHLLWKERNERRPRAQSVIALALAKMVDRQIQNRCLSFCEQRNFKLAAELSLWLAIR
ncbi:hypothetical protein N665_0186s0074 [Sinapis alba]|nr:hypothetical protein N665_0186s0074 [Sinapis alba]